MDSYSPKELLTIADKIWRRTRREMGSFDWPTFSAVFPQRAAVFKEILGILKKG